MTTIINKLERLLSAIVTIAIILFTVATIVMIVLQLVGIIIGNGTMITGVYSALYKPIETVSCLTGLASYLATMLIGVAKNREKNEAKV